MTEQRYLDVVLRSGARVALWYEGLEPAIEGVRAFAEQLRKAPQDRSRCHLLTTDVATDDGIGAAPLAAIDYREVVSVQVRAPVTMQIRSRPE